MALYVYVKETMELLRYEHLCLYIFKSQLVFNETALFVAHLYKCTEEPLNHSRARGYKTFFVLNSVEHEISNAHKYKNIKKFSFCQARISGECYFSCS